MKGREMVTLITIALWLTATLATYQMCRKVDENPAFVDFMRSLVFWPLLLACFTAGVALEAGRHYATMAITALEARRAAPALRSGSDNGLYE